MQSSRDYKNAVGPADLFDVIGAQQFCVLTQHGLRAHHKLLDIGCGCLRGGKFFINYLDTGNYFGIEPDKELVDLGIENELGTDTLVRKQPMFYYGDDFDTYQFLVKFNYVLAQSIFSHANQQQIKMCLHNVKQALEPRGKFVFTYFVGENNYTGEEWRQMPSATYRREWMKDQVGRAGFNIYSELKYAHPAGQVWVMVE